MALAKKSKLESAIEDLQSEERRLNTEIDQANAEIKASNAEHNAESEIEAAVRDTARGGADRYREHLKFALRTRDLAKLDLMPIQPVRHPSGAPIIPNIQLLVDGFYFLLENTEGAIVAIMNLAPRGGPMKAERERNEAAFEAKKLGLEGELENLYQQMERAGFQPRRRPDLSPKVFLNFTDKQNWSHGKFEAQRQRCSEIRAAQSKLTAKRSELIQERLKLEHLADDKSLAEDSNSRVKSHIETLTEEERSLNERISANDGNMKRETKIFNACVEFLREQGIAVDAHV